ncbi:MAG: PQQ-like beta-propeller repeat protein [Polyangiaceae bacterium]|nr:PQQ-like beta-propeller repeat protein [Polyangiaceae bacterium]
MTEVVERLRNARPLPSVDLAVGVAGPKSNKLVGVRLTGHSTWTFEHALDARPTIAGGVVVASGGGEVFALDALGGRRLWARPTGGAPFLGAGDDGIGTAITLARGMGSTMLVVARDGSVKRQMETDQQLGSPAVVSGVIFVPWKSEKVSAIDESTGDEIGRVTLQGKVTRAFTIGKDIYFGGERLIRFDDNIDLASNHGESQIALPPGDWLGVPRLVASGTERLPPSATTRDKIRIFARPSDIAGSLGFDSSRFYASDASDFRRVSGFDASSGRREWEHIHASDIVGGEAITGGVLICDETGKMTVLDAQAGQVVFERSFGEPIKSCIVHADTFHAPTDAVR